MNFTIASITRKLAVAATLCLAIFTFAPSTASAWAEYNGYQPSRIYNPSGGATKVYNYDKSSGGFVYVNASPYLYGSTNYTLWHPYVNRNYEHWTWDYSRGNWSAIHTKRLARY